MKEFNCTCSNQFNDGINEIKKAVSLDFYGDKDGGRVRESYLKYKYIYIQP